MALMYMLTFCLMKEKPFQVSGYKLQGKTANTTVLP